MNVKISYSVNLMASIWYQGSFYNNNYQIDLDFLSISDDPVEHNIAFERIKYLLTESLSDSIFINEKETKEIESFLSLGIKLSTYPSEPLDQIVGLVLHSKFNRVMQNKVVLENLSIQSYVGNNIVYHSDLEQSNSLPFEDGWWTDPGPVVMSTPTKIKNKNKVVKISSNQTWKNLDLEWQQKSSPIGDTVFFGQFDKDEKKSIW